MAEDKETWEIEGREEVKSNHSIGFADEEKDKRLGAAIKDDPIITAYTFALAVLGILLWGYDLVVVGTVASIPAFQ
jgi:hypothetical protein